MCPAFLRWDRAEVSGRRPTPRPAPRRLEQSLASGPGALQPLPAPSPPLRVPGADPQRPPAPTPAEAPAPPPPGSPARP